MRLDFFDLSKTSLNAQKDWAGLRLPSACEKGLVSVVVPTYNRAVFLPQAIASAADQTYRPLELLIVDDGSTDRSYEGAKAMVETLPEDPRLRIRYLRQPNRGASAARNQGLLHSRGEFIQYLDSDDAIVRTKVERHVRVLESAEDLDIVWSDWLVVPGAQLESKLAGLNQSECVEKQLDWSRAQRMLPWEPWPTLTRRRFLASQPLWNEFVSRWDDWEFALRQFSKNPSVAHHPGILCLQRTHDQGRRQDFDFNPQGVDVGMTACREAVKACTEAKNPNRQIIQAVAERCWETGIEALQRGTSSQALRAFESASKLAPRPAFRLKAALAWGTVKFGGQALAKRALARYFRPAC